ncbi:hypothetical protein [Thermococcus celericrescens]|uniref:hypothetical protein n=1 Tax=Thermococcus celericrescens TaxID=227598 RepID=UPI0012EE33F5|nr:hypothetical protein [Thermococcus celericrescens]
MIIVMHHPELENVADTLYLVKNIDGASQVREVESLEGEDMTFNLLLKFFLLPSLNLP